MDKLLLIKLKIKYILSIYSKLIAFKNPIIEFSCKINSKY